MGDAVSPYAENLARDQRAAIKFSVQAFLKINFCPVRLCLTGNLRCIRWAVAGWEVNVWIVAGFGFG